MSHFLHVDTVSVDTYTAFETVADAAGSSPTYYCNHSGYYGMLVVTAEGLNFNFTLNKNDPPLADQIDFQDTRQGSAIKVN